MTTVTQSLQEQLTSLKKERCRCLMEDDINELRHPSRPLAHVDNRGNVHGLDEYLHFVQEVAQVIDLRRGPLTVRDLGAGAAVMLGRQTSHSRARATGATVVTEAQVVPSWAREQYGAWRVSLFLGAALPAEHTK
jgi:hypothetical protein